MKNKSEIRISKVTNLFANTQIKNRKIKNPDIGRKTTKNNKI